MLEWSAAPSHKDPHEACVVNDHHDPGMTPVMMQKSHDDSADANSRGHIWGGFSQV